MSTILELALANAVSVTWLALLVLVVTRLVKHPQFAHALWLIVLLKLFTPPVFVVGIPWLDVTESGLPAPPIEIVAGEDSLNHRMAQQADAALPCTDDRLRSVTPLPTGSEFLTEPSVSQPRDGRTIARGILLTTWGIGSLLICIVVTRRVHRFNRLLRLAERAPDNLQREVARLAQSMGMIMVPDVVTIQRPISPALWAGGRRPRIILPQIAVDRLSATDRRGILAHELAHYRRRDHWVRWLELAATIVYWWHPAVWLARRELRFVEELCCDAIAIAETNVASSQDYAAALLTLLDACDTTAFPLASAMGTQAQMKQRIRILAGGVVLTRRMGGVLKIALAMFAAAALLFGSAWAQDEEAPAKAQVLDRANDEQAAQATFDGDLIAAGDILEIVVTGTFPEAPIRGKHVVEGGGQVAHGPTYGSVTLVGQSMQQAEQIINRHLSSSLVKPESMVRVPLQLPFKVAVPAAPYQIAAGEVLLIRVYGTLPEEPIHGLFRVEPAGTVALGPSYGRAKIAGLSLRDAEQAIIKHLQPLLQTPLVSITHGEWLLPQNPQRSRQMGTVSNTKGSEQVEQKYLQLLQQHLDRARASVKAGQDEELNLALAELEVAVAQARFAANRQDSRQAISEYKRAAQHANQAVSLAQSEYTAGLVSMTTVFEVAKKRMEVELALKNYEQAHSAASPAGE